jgi:hypothetical protein
MQTFDALNSAATSSFRSSCVLLVHPLATGFIPTARSPCRENARNNAQATSVLPMPVSVPVMKYPVPGKTGVLALNAASLARPDIDHWFACGPYARKRLPGMAVDNFKSRWEPIVLP